MQPDDNCDGTWECLKDVGPKGGSTDEPHEGISAHNCYSRKELISLRLGFSTVRKD